MKILPFAHDALDRKAAEKWASTKEDHSLPWKVTLPGIPLCHGSGGCGKPFATSTIRRIQGQSDKIPLTFQERPSTAPLEGLGGGSLEMKSERPNDVLQGTLDLLILRGISLGPLHGYGVLLRIHQMSGDELLIQQGFSAADGLAPLCGIPQPGRNPRLDWHHGAFWKDSSADECEIGDRDLPPLDGQGLATEGTRALIAWIREHSRTNSLIAHTFPRLKTSIRIMEKGGFVYDGIGEETGTVRYRLKM